MNNTITLNTKVFDKTSNPSGTSVILTTRARGVTLPDSILIAHRVQKNPVEAGSIDKLTQCSVQRTFVNADGVTKVGSWSLNSRTPDDMPSTDVDACLADLTAFMASEITLNASNIEALKNGSIA